MQTDPILDQLIWLSHEVAREERQLVILGEGNTGASCEDGTFWVKASGSEMRTIDAAGFSRVRIDAVMALLDNKSMDDEAVGKALMDVLVDPQHRRPSVETFLHALCIEEGDAKWVAHTHAVSVNAILCSKHGAEPFRRHLFPDGIVVCGPQVAVVPYVDPGLPLAQAVRDELHRFQDTYGFSPKLLLMENHGLVGLGQSATEALNINLMADKWAKTLLGAYAVGGPNPLSPQNVTRIDSRLDEHYRRQQLANKGA